MRAGGLPAHLTQISDDRKWNVAAFPIHLAASICIVNPKSPLDLLFMWGRGEGGARVLGNFHFAISAVFSTLYYYYFKNNIFFLLTAYIYISAHRNCV